MENDVQKKKKRILFTGCFAVFFFLVFLDQWSKHLAVVHLKGQAGIPLIRDVFELQYLENTGMAWGLLSGGRWLFLFGTAVILFLISYVFLKAPLTKRYRFLRADLAVLASGAVGNLIDRLFHGYVVDFFYFSLIDFPIFNVADCYVVVSGIVFVILFLFYYKDEELVIFLPSFLKEKNQEGDSGK